MAGAFWGRVRPKLPQLVSMSLLFFFLAFNNTLIDSTKDSIVVTSAGGAQKIPFLTLYAVLPVSVVLVGLFSFLGNRFRRATVFNLMMALFLGFFTCFGLVLFPNREALHLHGVADRLEAVLPAGLMGLTAAIRQWSFTLFYCMSEMWGDVMLSLNFWMLANATTSTEDAGLLYPLFGLGANFAQIAAGRLLRALPGLMAGAAYEAQLRVLMLCVLACGGATVAVHAWIARHIPEVANAKGARAAAAAGGAGGAGGAKGSKAKGSVAESFRNLARGPALRCLALMAIAQGISTNLLEVAWKSKLRELYPGPSDYSSFMGDVASFTGVCTALMMVVSPLLFAKLKWSQVATIAPRVLLGGGSLFFGAAIAMRWFAVGGPAANFGLVVLGALMYVFSRAAKFGFFKPAEEMVYLRLDDEARSKGKAAVDVVGAQFGKSLSSVLQQGLLVLSGGSLVSIFPVMLAAFAATLWGWIRGSLRLAAVEGMDGGAEAGEAAGGEAAGDADHGDSNGALGNGNGVAAKVAREAAAGGLEGSPRAGEV